MRINVKILFFMVCTLIVFCISGCGNNTHNIVKTVEPAIITEASDFNTASTSAETSSMTVSITASSATSHSSSTSTKQQTSSSTSSTSTVSSTETALSSTTVTTVTSVFTETCVSATVTIPNAEYISAPYAGVYSADSLSCLYEKNTFSNIYPASMTKLLTACTALYYASPDRIYTVGSEVNIVGYGSSLAYISYGNRLTLRDLLAGMLLCSGNDAAYTIAVNVARDVSGNPYMDDYEAVSCFVQLMNSYAYRIGAVNSNFTNPDGWDDYSQFTTVHDMALISAHAMQYYEIRNIVSCSSKYVTFASGENAMWYNSNALLHPESPYYLPQAIGLKTGTTPLAGNCLVAVINSYGKEYIVIVAGCETDSGRYEAVHQLINSLYS